MRGQAMIRILDNLEKRGENISEMRALELFGRDGSWQTKVFAPLVKSIDIWEIDPVYIEDLKKNIPFAKVTVTDSIKEIKNPDHFNRYDFIVSDNPQNCFGERREYSEHFDLLPGVLHLIDKTGIFIFNFNKQPFNAEGFVDWIDRRRSFYKMEKAMDITIPSAIQFYTNLFKQEGFMVEYSFSESRQDLEHNDYLHYLIFKLSRRAKN